MEYDLDYILRCLAGLRGHLNDKNKVRNFLIDLDSKVKEYENYIRQIEEGKR